MDTIVETLAIIFLATWIVLVLVSFSHGVVYAYRAGKRNDRYYAQYARDCFKTTAAIMFFFVVFPCIALRHIWRGLRLK